MKTSHLLAAGIVVAASFVAIPSILGDRPEQAMAAAPAIDYRVLRPIPMIAPEHLILASTASAPRLISPPSFTETIQPAMPAMAPAPSIRPVAHGGRFGDLIVRYARQNGVPLDLARAVVRVESNFRPNVRGRAGEVGLMQIKPATARLMGYRGGAKGLYDPETNIRYGMKYLGQAYRLGGKSTCGTVLRYNAGHGARRMNRISAAYCAKVKRILARG